ncbi:MAG: ABC transporter ATP-binding protein [Acidimicrobiales bacterium]
MPELAVPGREPAASCRGVVKVYRASTGPVLAVDGVDATFGAGRVVAVVGPSGSGKSSLLRLVAGLDRPSAGSVRVGGVELAGLSARRRRRIRRRLIGYVFQDPSHNLLPYLEAREQVELALALRGGRRAARGPQGEELLERVGLGSRARHLPGQLSGGEQQRLAFLTAVAGGPSVVVADEPTAELDSASAARLLALLVQLCAGGVTFVVSSHDPAVREASSDVVELSHGRLVRP